MRQWFKNLRHRRALEKRQRRLEKARRGTALREFVYLDEVSVYSLVASRLGPIATEQTDSTAQSWESQAAGKFGADLLAFDIESSAQLTHARSQGSQVLRKSVVQTTFKDLLEMEKEDLLLCSNRHLSAKRDKDHTPIAASRLKRGALVELEVELGVEDVFRMVTVISSMMGMIDSGTGLFPQELLRNLEQGRAVEGILRGLLTGLVPIRARVLDHEVHETEGGLCLRPTSPEEALSATALYLVGVAEERLFWKDIRRVLFSSGRYKVLARLSQDGLHNSWTPVKLAHVVENFLPNFSSQMTEGFWKGFSSATTEKSKTDEIEGNALGPALRSFAVLLGRRVGADKIPTTLDSIDAQAVTCQEESFDFDKYRVKCSEFAAQAMKESGQSISPAELSELRQNARSELSDLDQSEESITKPRDLYLDCEIVAIYW